jgi:MFS family permease
MLLYFSTTNTLIQTFVSDEFRGRVMGVWALVFGGMMPVGGLEAGTVSHFLGVKWTIAIGALVCACAAAAAARRTNPDSEPEAGAGRPIAS